MSFTQVFADREDAAEQLAQHLEAYRGRNPLVLAIPRGAVPMGSVLAAHLQGELDVVLVHKLPAPLDPEYAIGAVDENGWAYLDPSLPPEIFRGQAFEETKRREVARLRQRRADYSALLPPVSPQGRICIVIDDGLATGATMIAALHAIRERGPAELICAVPVAATDSLAQVRPLADKVVCLQAVVRFGAVSMYYRHFGQVEDREVSEILRRQGDLRSAHQTNATTQPAGARPEGT